VIRGDHIPIPSPILLAMTIETPAELTARATQPPQISLPLERGLRVLQQIPCPSESSFGKGRVE
jgi:hypothetical protein